MKLPEELQFIANARMPQKTTDARMDGRVCVVTGATSGVGLAAAQRLARGGAHLVIVCRNGEKAAAVQAELARDVRHADGRGAGGFFAARGRARCRRDAPGAVSPHRCPHQQRRRPYDAPRR